MYPEVSATMVAVIPNVELPSLLFVIPCLAFHCVAAFLQWKKTATKRVLTAYRFHDTELITFNSSFTLVWRNGEVNNTQGLKCVDGEEGQGHIIGNPTTTLLNANIWFYEW